LCVTVPSPLSVKSAVGVVGAAKAAEAKYSRGERGVSSADRQANPYLIYAHAFNNVFAFPAFSASPREPVLPSIAKIYLNIL
jgi:hypothetical protein